MNSTSSSNGEQGCRDTCGTSPDSPYCYVDNIQELLTSLVETACEHEKDLSLMRLINYVDLYRFHIKDSNLQDLRRAGNTQTLQLGENPVSFESFVSSSSLLYRAAVDASRHYGDEVAAPAPLRLSANDSGPGARKPAARN